VGVVLGIIIGASVPVNKLAKPVMWSLYAVPWLAYQPLSLAWFGFGLPPVIFIVFMASLFPILLNTAAGVGTTEPALLNVGRIFGASRASRYRKIVLPASLPFVFAGLRQSSVMATIALLVAEMKGPATGMGAFITFETNQLRVHNAFLGVVVLVLWTVIVSLVIGYIARRVAPWQSDARNS
jgi:ABC-type nitrate/sulfonate/bicarbonate transport system permease component